METTDQLCEALGIELSDEQLAAVTAPLAPGVIVAGAGTGKTTVMAARVVWLVGTGQVRADEILGLTFTRKAAGELGERVLAALERAGLRAVGRDEGVPSISTYDAFAARIVVEHGLRAGIDDAPMLVAGATSTRLMHHVVLRSVGPYPALAEYSLPTIIERAWKLDAAMRSNLVEPEEVQSFTEDAQAQFQAAPGYGTQHNKPYKSMLQAEQRCSERLELLRIVEEYRAYKRELGVAEFSDQLATAATLALEVPAVGAALRGQYAVVLLDEYQDTSSAQAALLKALFAGHPVTAVGDPYQAIYGWRGAAASNIPEFQNEFGAATVHTLSVNRRSHTSILTVGNLLASTIPGDEGVELRAPAGTQAGAVEAFRFDTEDEELDAIAEHILQLQDTCEWRHIAVLSRRRSLLAAMHQRLQARGVPTEIVGLGGLLWLPEIVPIVAMLRLLVDPLDNPSLATLLTGPRWNLPLPDLELLGRHAVRLADGGEPCLLEAAEHRPSGLTDAGAYELTTFMHVFARLRNHAVEPVNDLLMQVVRVLGIEEELRARGLPTDQLDAFIAACSDRPIIAGDTSLAGLVAFLDAEASDGEGLEQAVISESNSVKLATVHAAKGLEWDHVFLPALNKGVFPSTNRSGNWVTRAELLPSPLRGDAHSIPQLEEYSDAALKQYAAELKREHEHGEDRLAYVAATRARTRLVATCHRWANQAKNEREPSRYFLVCEQEARHAGTAVDATTGCENPELETKVAFAWPALRDEDDQERQSQAAALVHAAKQHDGADEWVLESGRVADEELRQFRLWDESAAHVLSRQQPREIRLPQGLSATQLMQLRDDPQALAEQLVRRMPRKPSSAASLGTAFHDWVQRRFEMPSGFDEFERQPPALQTLIDAFERGRFAERTPLACEVPFSMVVGGFQIRGRIDAVYRWEGEFDELVVDWKTFDSPADELQLAVYRRAWAEARGLEPERVGAAFYHVRSDRLVFAGAPPELVDAAAQLQR
ncbi:ATP-dependent DNA helicase [uncultured Tessaracoccus sp.]|uniref:ATP-dependent DNA helicase n=1 Tax=uncultured Tessaracoccus sp. TaxID=905023 RepID=UPI002613DDE7|nr:ATP-dependent DNA helicase [uncultured Tessaracoccus sp.]